MINKDRLKEIGEQVRILRAGLLASMRLSTEKAIQIGRLIEEVKGGMPLRDFYLWVNGNCGFSVRSAFKYIKLARNKTPLAQLAEMTLTEAYEFSNVAKNKRDARQTTGRLALRFEEFVKANPKLSTEQISGVKLFLEWLRK